ncbi:MAG: porin family protein [Deltaproteobacteria bacterium]|nr:porin family protein [Deltaproteobacteria bacterium]
MKRLLAGLLLLATSCLCFPTPSAAKPPPPNYVAAKAGGFFPVASDLEGFDAGFAGELSVGRYVTPGFALEGGVGHFETRGESSGARRSFEATSLLFTLKGVAPFAQWEGFAELGFGIYFLRDEVPGDSDEQTRVGAHAGVGGTFSLSRHVFLGLEGRYVLLTAETFGGDTRLDGISVTGNLGYRF